jgi:diguanylate cyclase (GGDEF)-like protein
MAADEKPPKSESLRDLMIFHNVARALTSSLDRDAILRAIMEQMEKFFQPETWSLLLLDESSNELYYAVAIGRAEAELRNIRVPVGHGLAGWVAEHGESLIVPEVSQDSRYEERFVASSQAGSTTGFVHVRSAICMPLRSRLRTLGVIQLFNCHLETLSDYTIAFLHLLCDYAAIAIENARDVEKIKELTITDDCTGLYNVRHLYRQAEAEIERALRFHSQFSLVFIDLDHFKQVNDAHGHLMGSRLLMEVGQAFKSTVRAVDTVFRYGGDEFVVLLPETNKRQAEEAAMRLLTNLRSRSFDMGSAIVLQARASFGISTYPEDGQSVQQMIRCADDMMYLVKASTRNDIAVAGMGLVKRQAESTS